MDNICHSNCVVKGPNIGPESIYTSVAAKYLYSLAPDSCDGAVCELTDQNSSVVVNGFATPKVIDDGDGFKEKVSGGLLQWEVDNLNLMFAHWHWFRVEGGTKEIAVGGIDHDYDNSSFTQDPGTKQIVLKYIGGLYSPIDIELDYTLHGGQSASFTSSSDYQVKVTNRTASSLNVKWFVYNDLDLTTAGFEDQATSSPDGKSIRQTTCPRLQPRLIATDVGLSPPEAYTLDIFTGRLVQRGGRANVLDLLLDNSPTDLATFQGEPAHHGRSDLCKAI